MSYRTIISVVNEHTASTIAARYAVSLALACKAELVLYAAHEEGSNETILLRTRHHMDHLYTIASALNIPVTMITETGNIDTLLPKRVKADSADLVLYPLLPDERYGANLRRHTVHHLLRTISSDLAITRTLSMAKPHPRNILVPLGKIVDDNERRFMFVAELAGSFQSQVTLFHISAEQGTEGLPEHIIRFRKQLEQRQIAVLERRGRGNIDETITVEAITRHNDLIVLGASGRGVLRRLFIGNPAGDVMQRPPCNTIIFRPAP